MVSGEQLLHAERRRQTNLAVQEIVANTRRRALAVVERIDQRLRPEYTIATSKHAAARGLQRVRVHRDAVPAVACNAFLRLQRVPVHLLADRRDEEIALHERFTTGNRLDAAPALGVEFGLTHLHEFDALQLAILDNQRRRIGEAMEDDPLFFGGVDFVVFRRHILDGAPIDEMHRTRAHAPCRAHAIHGHVAAADDDHVALDRERLAVFDVLVHIEQEVDARGVADRLLLLVAHAERRALARAVTEKHRVVAARQQGIEREIATEHLAVEEVAAQLADDVLALGLHHILGQTIARDADRRHAARRLLRVEDVDLEAIEQQLVGAGDPRWPCTDHRDALRVLHRRTRELEPFVGQRLIGGVTLEHADADRAFGPGAAAGVFAEAHADAPAGRGHRVLFENDAEREVELAALDAVDVLRHVDLRRARLDAWCRRIGETVLEHRLRRRQRFELVAEMAQRVEQRAGAALPEAAQRRATHLLGQFLEFLERTGRRRAIRDALQQVAHPLGADTTWRAPAAGLAGRVAHVLAERFGQRNVRIKDKETPVGDERLGRIVRCEIVEPCEGDFKTGRPFGTVIVNLPVPNPIH